MRRLCCVVLHLLQHSHLSHILVFGCRCLICCYYCHFLSPLLLLLLQIMLVLLVVLVTICIMMHDHYVWYCYIGHVCLCNATTFFKQWCPSVLQGAACIHWQQILQISAPSKKQEFQCQPCTAYQWGDKSSSTAYMCIRWGTCVAQHLRPEIASFKNEKSPPSHQWVCPDSLNDSCLWRTFKIGGGALTLVTRSRKWISM